MRLYCSNYKEDIIIAETESLPSSVWQALELYDNLPEDDGSYIALMDADDVTLKFTKYNRYVWLIEIPKPQLKGSYQGYFTKNRCKMIITEVYGGLPFSQLTGLSFEKYS